MQQDCDSKSFGNIIVAFENDTLRVTVVRDRGDWSCAIGTRHSAAAVDVLEALDVMGELATRDLLSVNERPSLDLLADTVRRYFDRIVEVLQPSGMAEVQRRGELRVGDMLARFGSKRRHPQDSE